MGEVREVRLKDGSSFYVEMEISDISGTAVTPVNDLPEGAEPTSTVEQLKDTMELVKNTLKSIANIVHEGMQLTKPDQWALEINIGFKGKANPIPVILSGESSAAIKVTAKWSKKGKEIVDE